MLSLEKISSRHIPRKILYPVTKPKTVFALSPTNVWQAPFLANFVSRRIHCIHSYLSNCIFPSSPFFSPSFFLCFIHPPLFIDIFSRKNKIRAKECTHFVVYISVLVLSVPSVENSRWWRSSTSVAPREEIRMHKYVPVKRVPFAVPIS